MILALHSVAANEYDSRAVKSLINKLGYKIQRNICKQRLPSFS
ncbi:MAG: hypothetical protein ACMUEL_02155 [Flavobacteriales bacterium Tduv]